MPENTLNTAKSYIRNNEGYRAIELLHSNQNKFNSNIYYWHLLGIAYHQEQQEVDALNAYKNALSIDDNDFDIAINFAQSCFYTGFELCAIKAFHKAIEINTQSLSAIKGLALAYSSIGEFTNANQLLQETLSLNPEWLDGHKTLTNFLFTQRNIEECVNSYCSAIIKRPKHLPLRLEYFNTLVQLKNWEQAQAQLEEIKSTFDETPEALIAELLLASETQDDSKLIQLTNKTESLDSEIRDMALVRFLIRNKKFKDAERIAIQRVEKSSARSFIPYLDLIWRLQKSPYYDWLNGANGYIKSFDLSFSKQELNDLSAVLNKLHNAKNYYPQHSVRGGTQTDQNLFLRHEAILVKTKTKVKSIVSQYAQSLPKPQKNHPLLDVPRTHLNKERIYFNGSWSVKLKSQGFNISHTHPLGWVSAALYISVPSQEKMGKEPSGWLQFGTPPPELNLDLKPTQKIKPTTGKLVLFPSTQWHSTVPFSDGERLVISFDVQKPAY